jgi:hypothetical protein
MTVFPICPRTACDCLLHPRIVVGLMTRLAFQRDTQEPH